MVSGEIQLYGGQQFLSWTDITLRVVSEKAADEFCNLG